MLKNFEKIYKKSKFRKRERNRNFQRFVKFFTFETVETFETLKICFIEISLLHHFNFICEFRIEIDIFNKTIKKILIQFIDNE